jgi:hypothetical protein
MSREQEVDIFGISPDNVDIDAGVPYAPIVSCEEIEAFLALSEEEQEAAMNELRKKNNELLKQKEKEFEGRELHMSAARPMYKR